MKKRNLVLFLTIFALLLLTLVMSACSPKLCETHDWTEWCDDGSATCTTGGTQNRNCRECGLMEWQDAPPLGHSGEVFVVKKPTCTENGLSTSTCSRCGLQTETVLPSMGHGAAIGDPNCAECKSVWGGGLDLEFEIYGDSAWVKGIGECTDTELKIPSSYMGVPVTTIDYRAFFGCETLTSITIPDSVVYIRNDSFDSCTGLIQIENGVSYVDKWVIDCEGRATSVVLRADTVGIAESAFSGCDDLTSITIPDGVKNIGSSAFSGCDGLTSITISDGVKKIGDLAFSGCDSLTSITIPDSVTSLGNRIFSDCVSLTNVTIGNGVENIYDETFDGCVSLYSITVGDGNAKYKTIDGNLYTKDGEVLLKYAADKNDTSFTVPNGVERINSAAFKGCSKLVSITLPDGLWAINSDAFAGCTSLSGITIPNSVTSIGVHAFSDCVSLTSVTIPEKVESFGSNFASHAPVFDGCINLSSITVAAGNKKFQSIDGNVYTKDGTELLQYAPGKSAASFTVPNGVTKICTGAFKGCTSLVTVTIPDGVKEVESYVFSYCDNLKEVVLPASATNIVFDAFRYASALTAVYYGGTAKEYSYLSITDGNTEFTVYLYSEQEPAADDDGSYWRYVNGVPTKW